MKHRKPTKSAKARLVQETIDNAQPGNNKELGQNDTTSRLPSPDRKRELFDELRHLLKLVDKAFTDPNRPQFPNEVNEKLLITIGELQLHIDRKSDYRAPSW